MESLSASCLDALPQLLVQVFGSNAVSACSQVLNQHHDYCVLSVQMPTAEVIVKLAGRKSMMDASFERTAFIHNLLQTRTDIPVANIIAADDSYAQFPWRYLIQSRLQGTIWAQLAPQLEPAQRRTAYEQIGSTVAQMHAIAFPAFGEINSTEKHASFVGALLRRSERTIQQPHLRVRFAQVIKERAELFESVTQPVLCHDDLHHYNILFDHERGNWRLAGILDFDKAWAGHAETDLARLDFWDNMMGDGFREAYMALHDIEFGYDQRRLVYQLLWCLEYALPTPRHRADLARVCEALNITPIAL